jgi:hypothetical protein
MEVMRMRDLAVVISSRGYVIGTPRKDRPMTLDEFVGLMQ